MIHEQIKTEIKEAMKAHDEVKLSVVRGLSAAFTNELVATSRKPDETLSDEQALSVIRRAAKQRRDSIEQFRAGNREDLAAKEEAELTIIESYLPQLMSRDEITKIVAAKKAELSISDKSQAGKFIGAVMSELKGKADGADVKAVVDELLS